MELRFSGVAFGRRFSLGKELWFMASGLVTALGKDAC
jgi:hypothetical protein